MSIQTLIIAGSPFLSVFQEAANNSRCEVKQLGDNLYLSSWPWADIQPYVETDLTATPVQVGIKFEGETKIETPFDPANDQPQEMTSDYFLKLKAADKTGLFFPPAAEPEPEPRYQTSFTSLEFVEHIGEELEDKIYAAAAANLDVHKWKDRMFGAEKVSVLDPRTIAGFNALVTAGLVTEQTRDKILKGRLIPSV